MCRYLGVYLHTVSNVSMHVQDDQGYPGTFEEYIMDSGLDVEVAGLQPIELDNTQVCAPFSWLTGRFPQLSASLC